jgi:hypothetical protein
MLAFPAGIVFTPYTVLRNASSAPLIATPTFWWMAGGTAHSAQFPALTLHAGETRMLDVPGMLIAAGLKKFSGTGSLVFDVQGNPAGLLMAGGSVDQKYSYVFGVVPRGVKVSAAKNLSYWSIGSGDDTMVTLWNAADEAQDLIFRVMFEGGHYDFPRHLGPRATQVFNISEIVHIQLPDAEGNVIPVGITEGSAELMGAQGEVDSMLVAMDAGIYNVRKATCGTYSCETCNGVTGTSMNPSPFTVAVGGTIQLDFIEYWNSGQQYHGGDWTSYNTSVATVSSSGLVTGIAAGSANIHAQDHWSEPTYTANFCGYNLPSCPVQPGFPPGDQAYGTFTPTITKSKSLWFFGTGISTPSGFTLGATSATLTANGAGTGKYVWTVTRGTLQVKFSDNNSSTITKTNVNTVQIASIFESTQANDVTVQLQFTPTGGSQITTAISLSVDSPYKLTSGGAPNDYGVRLGSDCTQSVIGTDGYLSYIPYSIISFFGQQMTNIEHNEFFGAKHNDVSNNNWAAPAAMGSFSPSGAFVDCLLVVGYSTPPTEPPQSSLNQLVFDIPQTWYIGSEMSGTGLPVQFDTINYYQNHGRHVSITSPVR